MYLFFLWLCSRCLPRATTAPSPPPGAASPPWSLLVSDNLATYLLYHVDVDQHPQPEHACCYM